MNVCKILGLYPDVNTYEVLECLRQRYKDASDSVLARPAVITELENALQQGEQYHRGNCQPQPEYPYDSEGCKATGISKEEALKVAIREHHLSCGQLQSLSIQQLDWLRREICRTDVDSLISAVVDHQIVPELLRLSGFTREDVIDVDPEYLDQPCNRSWESLANEIVATPDQQDQDRDQDIWLVRIEDDEDADEQATELPAPTGVELPVEIRKREDFVGKQVNQDLLDAIGMTKELRALERAFIEIEKYEVYAYRRMQVA